jgi:anaerobic selenocysteine-containing dehydrogenase
MAVNTLNALAGNVGRTGGVRFFEAVTFLSDVASSPSSERALADLAGEFRHGRRKLLHLYGSNPLFTVPPSVPVREMFEKADFIVSFSSFLDESTAMADLILPDHFFLEAWSDHVQDRGGTLASVGLGQPVVMPLYETRAIGDVFLDAAGRLSLTTSARLPEKSFYGLLQARWKAFFAERNTDASDWDGTWARHLRQGGSWEARSRPVTIAQQTSLPTYEPAIFQGDEQQFPFFFYPYPSMALGYGEGANMPWLQELPNTLTTAAWSTWVEINPKTAHANGVQQGELLRVTSPYGSLEAPAVYVAGIRPDMIAMPIGQGHTAYGRYAKGRGTNPLSILGPGFDADSGGLAAASTRVTIEPTGMRGRLVLLEQPGINGSNDLITIDQKESR